MEITMSLHSDLAFRYLQCSPCKKACFDLLMCYLSNIKEPYFFTFFTYNRTSITKRTSWKFPNWSPGRYISIWRIWSWWCQFRNLPIQLLLCHLQLGNAQPSTNSWKRKPSSHSCSRSFLYIVISTNSDHVINKSYVRYIKYLFHSGFELVVSQNS